MRIVLTGASGLLGREVVHSLETEFLGSGISLDLVMPSSREIDLGSPTSGEQIASLGGDWLVHLAGDLRASHMQENTLVNSEMMKNVIAGSKGFSAVIVASSAAAYSLADREGMKEEDFSVEEREHRYGYPIDKRLATLRFLDNELNQPITALMLPNLYSSSELTRWRPHRSLLASAYFKLVEAEVNGERFVQASSPSSVSRQFLHASDVGDWLASALLSERRLPNILNLGSEENISVGQAFEAARVSLGSDLEIRFSDSNQASPSCQSLDFTIASTSYNWKPERRVLAEFSRDVRSVSIGENVD